MEPLIDTAKLLEQFKQQIAATRAELGRTMQKEDELTTQLAHLQEIAASLARMLGQEYIAEDAIGLTDAIRQAFRTAPNTQMNAIGVRARLQQMGFDLTQYGNVLASIHTVLGRLQQKNEIRPTGMVGNSQAYMANPIPPPKLSDVLVPRPTPTLDTTKTK